MIHPMTYYQLAWKPTDTITTQQYRVAIIRSSTDKNESSSWHLFRGILWIKIQPWSELCLYPVTIFIKYISIKIFSFHFKYYELFVIDIIVVALSHPTNCSIFHQSYSIKLGEYHHHEHILWYQNEHVTLPVTHTVTSCMQPNNNLYQIGHVTCTQP